MNGKKILFLVKTLLVAACLLFGAAVFTACGEEQGKDFPSITFTSEASGDLGEYYRLEMAVPSGVTVEGVSVKNSMNERVLLDEDYGFTPVNYGLYVYSVDARFKEQTKTFTFKVTVADKDAPVITRAPENVTADCGLYDDFEEDLSLMEVVCKNQSLAAFLTVKAIKIEGANLSVTNEEGFKSYLFDKTGDYTITVKAETVSGKSSACTYVISVKDGKDPVISISENVFTWVIGGKITLPLPRVYDFSDSELTYKVEKDGEEQTVTDGKVAASAGDVFKVTYTATDASGNDSSVTATVYALAEGTIISGNNAAFASAIKVGEGVAEFINGGLYVQSGARSDEFSFKGSAYAYKTERDYASVKLDIYNEQSVNVTLGVNAHYGAAKVRVGEISLINGANVKYIPVENAKGITGLSFEAASDKRIKLKINGVSFAAVTGGNEVGAELKPNPVYELDIAGDAIYSFKTSTGEAFTKRTADVFGTECATLYSGVKAGAVNSALFNQKITLSGVNYVELSVFSDKNENVTFGLIVNDGKTVYINAALAKGVNAVKCYLINPEITSINGLSFKNNEAYDIDFYVGAINFYNQTAITAEEIFYNSVGVVTLNYGESLVVPEVVNFNLKAIVALDIVLKKGDTVVKTGLSVGEAIDVYAGEDPEGEYTLVYTVTDVFGATHDKSVTVIASEKEFYAEIKLTEDYYAGDTINLPDPVISGSLYEAHASEVKVNKYYKVQGGTQWVPADEGFIVYSNAYVDVKYSVYVEGVVSELAETTFYVHAGGVTFDYELMADGTYLGAGEDYEPKFPATISSNWSHDGKYSMYMPGAKYYDIFAGMVFPEGIALDKTCNAVIFYAYSDKDASGDTSIGVLTTDKGWSETYIRIKKGAHKYVVPLPKEFNGFTKFGGQVKRGEGYYIDSVSFDYLLDMSVEEQNGSILSGTEFTLAKPVINSYSKAAFTEKQIEGAVYRVEITDASGETNEYRFTSDGIKLTLAKGEYDLRYTVEVGEFTFEESGKLKVTDLPVKFFNVQTGFNLNTEYTFKMPELEDGFVADKKLEYRLEGAAEWSLATDGKITFTAFGKYELRFTASAGDKSDEKIYNVVVRDADTIMDFETDENGNHHGWYSNPYEPIASKTAISDEWSADGEYSLKIVPMMDSWGGVKFSGTGKSIVLAEECNFIEFYVKTERAIAGWEFELRGGGVTTGGVINLNSGAHKYGVQLPKAIKTIDSYVIFRIKPEFGTIYVDAVRLYSLSVDFPTDIPTEATVNKTLTLGNVTAEGSETVVKYKNAGDDNYSIAEKTAEGFNVTFTAVGTGEILYEVTVNGVTLTKAYTVDVQEFTVKWQTLPTGVLAGESLTIALPTTEAGLTVTATYKRKDAADWTTATFINGNCVITFTTEGDYVIKLVVDSGDNQAEKEYAVYARTVDSIFDFETDENDNHHGVATAINATCWEGGPTDTWSANGKYSLHMHPTNNSWAGYDYSANPINLEYATNKFEIWVKASVEVKGWTIELNDGTGWKSASIDLKAGAYKYTFTINKYISKITKIDFRANGAAGTAEYTGDLYLDGLTAVYDELILPAAQQKTAIIGEQVELAGLTAPRGATVTVKWRMYGDTDYSEIIATDGKYTVTFSKYGTAEVVYEVVNNGAKQSKTYYIYVDEYRFTERY